MPVENSSINGFREISEGLIVCNSCGKIHQIYGANRKPLKCEACSERFVNAPSVKDEAEGEIVHYELDCPECETHYEIDLSSGPVIFDCGACGCSFTVEEESGYRKSGSQAQAAEAVVEIRTGRSKKGRLSKRAALSISKQKEKHPWLNSVLSFIVATLVCIGFVVYMIMQAFEDRAIDPSPGEGDVAPKLADISDGQADEAEDIFSIHNLSDVEAGAFINELEGFVGARSLEDKAKVCRFPGVARIRMQQHYANEIYEADSLVNKERVGPVQLVAIASGQKFLQARFRDQDGSESIYVGEPVAGGRFVFEWETTVQFSELPWEQIETENVINQSLTAMVRLQKSTQFSGEFSSDEYASYQVFYKGLGDGFVAYAQIGSEPEKALSKVFTLDQFPLLGVNERPFTKHVMIKFDFPKEWNLSGGSRYGRILEVVQEDWVRYGK